MSAYLCYRTKGPISTKRAGGQPENAQLRLDMGSAVAQTAANLAEEAILSIDKQSDVAANIQIGPTDQGMVRIYIEGDGVDLPLDFDPDEADEIAEELRTAAAAARAMVSKSAPRTAR